MFNKDEPEKSHDPNFIPKDRPPKTPKGVGDFEARFKLSNKKKLKDFSRRVRNLFSKKGFVKVDLRDKETKNAVSALPSFSAKIDVKTHDTTGRAKKTNAFFEDILSKAAERIKKIHLINKIYNKLGLKKQNIVKRDGKRLQKTEQGQFNGKKKGKKEKKKISIKELPGEIINWVKGLQKQSTRMKRLELNLITVEFIDPRQVYLQAIKLGAVVFFALFIVAVIWYVLQGIEKDTDQYIKNLKENTAQVDAEISKLQKMQEENKAVEGLILNVSNILENHIYFTKFFETLESLTRRDVFFGETSVSLKTSYAFDVTTLSVKSLFSQFDIFSKAEGIVNSVKMNSYSFEHVEIAPEFIGAEDQKQETIDVFKTTMQVEFSPDVFFK